MKSFVANIKSENASTKNRKANGLFFQPKLSIDPVSNINRNGDDVVSDRIELPNISAKITPHKYLEHKKQPIQRKEIGEKDQSEAPLIVSEVLSSAGSPLDDNSRSFMESRFGYDFSAVKIHTGSKAAKSAQSIDALAYTSGSNIVFNNGQYLPDTNQGKKLLAHELAHVVQQSSGNVQTKRIQRECLRTAPGSDETPFVFDRNGQRVAAEFSDAAGADAFIRSHSGQNLVCHRITRSRRTIFKVYQRRATAGGSPASTPVATVQDEIFNDTEVGRMRSFFIRNASAEDSLACINTVRSGIGSLIYDDSNLTDGTCPSALTMTAHNTMEETMAQLGTHNMASAVATIRFNDSTGTVIGAGNAREPMQLASSVWTTLVTATGSATGWSVFGVSLCDGFHSAVITVDHRNRDNIIMFWSDQTGNHPVQTSDRISGVSGDQFGWERMAQTGTSVIGSNPRGLGEYMRYAVRSFWGLHADEARGTTPLTQAQREGRSLGTCAPLIRLWRISRP
jgi:hypothetical protein